MAAQFVVEVGAVADDVVVRALEQVQQVRLGPAQPLDALRDDVGVALHGLLPVLVPARGTPADLLRTDGVFARISRQNERTRHWRIAAHG